MESRFMERIERDKSYEDIKKFRVISVGMAMYMFSSLDFPATSKNRPDSFVGRSRRIGRVMVKRGSKNSNPLVTQVAGFTGAIAGGVPGVYALFLIGLPEVILYGIGVESGLIERGIVRKKERKIFLSKLYNLVIIYWEMGKTIGLISIKGGVGKTTLSCAVASDLAYNHGKKVLLVDANYSAPNLGIHMNIISPKKTIHDVLSGGVKLSASIHRKYGVDVIPGNFLFDRAYSPLKLKNKLAGLKRFYDFIVLDGSPSLNDEVLSTMIASDHLFVVSTPDYPTLSCSMKAAKMAKQRNKPIEGIILNKVRGKKYRISLEEVQESTGIPVVALVLDDRIVDMALFERVPATLFAKNTGFSKEIGKFSSALLGNKEKGLMIRKILRGNLKKEQVNRELMRRSFSS